MATYSATAVPAPSHGQAGMLQTIYSLVTISAAPLINDVLSFGISLPANARVHGATLKASDMDTSTGMLIDVGDAGSATRYFSSSTVGQAATVDTGLATAGRFYKTTTKTPIVGLIHTAPSGTGSSGTVELSITYCVEDLSTSP